MAVARGDSEHKQSRIIVAGFRRIRFSVNHRRRLNVERIAGGSSVPWNSSPQFWANFIERNFLKELSVLKESVFDRLLPTFNRIDDESNSVAKAAWQSANDSCGPDADGFIAAERAEESGADHYVMMVNVRQSLVNLFAVALYHLVEQQQLILIRRALIPMGSEEDDRWMKPFEFQAHLEIVGIRLAGRPSWEKLRELRLAANIVKHAEGDSAEKLRKLRPEMFFAPSLRENQIPASAGPPHSLYKPLSGEDFFVTADDLQEYFGATEEFWNALVIKIRDTQPPPTTV